ncbi:hypothetical protein CVT25_001464, partial [Psilocybe cyanescens]
VWRCYHIWGRSKRVIVVPLALLLLEAGLWVIYNTFVGFAIFTTTIVTTSLIAYKLYSTSISIGASTLQHFRHVVTIVLESAAASSITILIFAIIPFLQWGLSEGFFWRNVYYYMEVLVIAVTGMASTVLVARIALTRANNSAAHSVPTISGLQFQHSRSHTGGYNQSGNADAVSPMRYELEHDETRQDEERAPDKYTHMEEHHTTSCSRVSTDSFKTNG